MTKKTNKKKSIISMKKLLGDLEQQERDRAREHVQFDRQPVGQVTSSPFNIIARRVTDWN